MSVEIPIDFIARFESSVKDLKKFTDLTGKEVEKMQSGFKGLQDAAALVFGAVVVKKGIDTLVNGFKDVTRAGAEYETEVIRLGQALRINNEYSEDAVKTFIALGDEMQANTKYAGGEIVNQIALAKAYGLTNEETEKLVRASVDLAAATGKDLSTATEVLAKTYSGQAGQLGKMVKGVNTLTEAQLLSGKAVDLVAKQYRGFAAAELQTFSGLIDKIGQNYEDLLEAFGRPITESGAVKQLLKEINDLIVSGTDEAISNRQAISDFVASFIEASFVSIGVIAKIFGAVYDVFQGVVTIIQFAIDSLQAFFQSGVAIGKLLSGDLAGAVKTLSDEFSETAEAFNKVGAGAANSNKLIDSMGMINARIQEANYSTKQLADGAGVLSTKFDDSAKSADRFGKSLKSDFEALVKDLEKNVGDPIENLTATLETNTKLIKNAVISGLTSETRGAELIGKLRLSYEKQVGEERQKQLDLERKRFQEFVGRIKEINQNPLKIFAGGQDNRGNSLGLSEGQQMGVAAGLGGVQQLLGGKEGARKFLGAAASAVGTAFLGPAGEALGPIVETLSQGPEAVKNMIKEFAQALPELIENIILAIPEVLIETMEQLPLIVERMIERAPEIIQRLIERLPDVIAAFIRNIPKMMMAMVAMAPRLFMEMAKQMGPVIGKFLEGAVQFTGKLLEGAGQFIGKILEGAVNFIGEIISGAGRFIDELVKGIGNIGGGGGFLGTGIGGSGGLIPDSVPIIGGLFKAGESYSGNMMSEKSGGGSQQVSVSVEISRKQLAEAILEINQMGYRTA